MAAAVMPGRRAVTQLEWGERKVMRRIATAAAWCLRGKTAVVRRIQVVRVTRRAVRVGAHQIAGGAVLWRLVEK
jgi:hypothetical protein